jgi:sporulation protein YlmC with PRC-barrel domain
MTLLVRARDLIGRPVVTLDGDDVGQIRDIVYAESTGSVVGFTLAGRTMLSGPMRETLPWKHIHSVGRHAVASWRESAHREP